jgi:hypothetical protein
MSADDTDPPKLRDMECHCLKSKLCTSRSTARKYPHGERPQGGRDHGNGSDEVDILAQALLKAQEIFT